MNTAAGQLSLPTEHETFLAGKHGHFVGGQTVLGPGPTARCPRSCDRADRRLGPEETDADVDHAVAAARAAFERSVGVDPYLGKLLMFGHLGSATPMAFSAARAAISSSV
jgi:hypothetical protein